MSTHSVEEDTGFGRGGSASSKFLGWFFEPVSGLHFFERGSELPVVKQSVLEPVFRFVVFLGSVQLLQGAGIPRIGKLLTS